VFTHKPVRDGSSITISIFGENGERFARRIAENAVHDGERLSPVFDVTPDGVRQKFLFHVEERASAASPYRSVVPRGSRRRLHLFRPAPQQGLTSSLLLGIGHAQLF
jgi:hypothetical protein